MKSISCMIWFLHRSLMMLCYKTTHRHSYRSTQGSSQSFLQNQHLYQQRQHLHQQRCQSPTVIDFGESVDSLIVKTLNTYSYDSYLNTKGASQHHLNMCIEYQHWLQSHWKNGLQSLCTNMDWKVIDTKYKCKMQQLVKPTTSQYIHEKLYTTNATSVSLVTMSKTNVQHSNMKLQPKKTSAETGSGNGLSKESIATIRSAREASAGTPIRAKARSKQSSEVRAAILRIRTQRITNEHKDYPEQKFEKAYQKH